MDGGATTIPASRHEACITNQTFDGVDYYGHSRDELYARARKLGVSGRWTMTKKELAKAIARKQS